jgi:hypothetical protein
MVCTAQIQNAAHNAGLYSCPLLLLIPPDDFPKVPFHRPLDWSSFWPYFWSGVIELRFR